VKSFKLMFGIYLLTTIRSRSIIGALRAAHRYQAMSTHIVHPDGREFSTI